MFILHPLTLGLAVTSLLMTDKRKERKKTEEKEETGCVKKKGSERGQEREIQNKMERERKRERGAVRD